MPISINLDSNLTFKLEEAAAKEQVSRSRFIASALRRTSPKGRSSQLGKSTKPGEGAIVVGRFDFTGDEMDIPYNTLLG